MDQRTVPTGFAWVVGFDVQPRHRVRPVPRQQIPAEQALARSGSFLEAMRTRRTVRDFSDRPVPFELVHNAIATATTAPSGANLQPWRFMVVADPQRKRRLRAAAEREERAFYQLPCLSRVAGRPRGGQPLPPLAAGPAPYRDLAPLTCREVVWACRPALLAIAARWVTTGSRSRQWPCGSSSGS
jgi:nitroreductase